MAPPRILRSAVPADYERFLPFFAELGLPDDPVPGPDQWAAEWMPSTIFLEIDGIAAGYGVLRILRGTAYVFHLVTAPSHRGQGVGRALMDELASRARAAGCSQWALNVKEGNASAIRLYQRCGMSIAYRATAMDLAWADTGRLPRDPGEALPARAVDPGEDAGIEAAFGLLAGRLTGLRASAGRVILRLADPRSPDDLGLGFVCFDPAFPGASPFRVARPTLAAPLLDAIRPHARPGDAGVRLVVENDDALTAALTAAGARTKLALFHMRGDVPPPPAMLPPS